MVFLLLLLLVVVIIQQVPIRIILPGDILSMNIVTKLFPLEVILLVLLVSSSLLSANNDTIIIITSTVNITIPHDLTPTGIDIMITSGTFVIIQQDYL